MHTSDCDTCLDVQRTLTEPDWAYVPTRDSDLDAACEAAGPGFAVVADAQGVRGIVRFDVEANCPIDAIPPVGFVS